MLGQKSNPPLSTVPFSAQLIAPNDDFIKLDKPGRIKESDDVSRSLIQDVKKAAKKKVEPGYGDQGDQPKKKTATKTSASKKPTEQLS